MVRYKLIIVTIFYLLIFTFPIYASVVNVSGKITSVGSDSGEDLRLGKYESSNYIYLFTESKNYTLQNDLYVDHLVTTDTNGWISSSDSLTPGTLPSGTKINVYLIHFDPYASNNTSLNGSITFSNKIIGLEVKKTSLNNSDFLGFASNYATDQNLRGLELNNQDKFSISNNQKTISLDLFTNVSLDEVRIITATPIPSSIFILIAGVITLFTTIGIRKKREI